MRRDRRAATPREHMSVVIPHLLAFTDVALLCLRFMVAVIFLYSGWSHVRDPAGRAESIGMSPSFTQFLGWAEMAGALGVASGVLAQLAALGLALIMGGAIHKKLFVWHTGFWGEGNSGWHYDLMLVAMNLVIATTGGGRLSLG
jgi:putative oxidoreductase